MFVMFFWDLIKILKATEICTIAFNFSLFLSLFNSSTSISVKASLERFEQPYSFIISTSSPSFIKLALASSVSKCNSKYASSNTFKKT